MEETKNGQMTKNVVVVVVVVGGAWRWWWWWCFNHPYYRHRSHYREGGSVKREGVVAQSCQAGL
jgi:hypothetical protein